MRTMGDLTADDIRRLMRSMVYNGMDNTNADWYDVTNATWESIYGRLCSIISNLDDSQLVGDDVVVEYAVE